MTTDAGGAAAAIERAAVAMRERDEAAERFRASVLAALEQGATRADLARALGVSRQAVGQMVKRS